MYTYIYVCKVTNDTNLNANVNVIDLPYLFLKHPFEQKTCCLNISSYLMIKMMFIGE